MGEVPGEKPRTGPVESRGGLSGEGAQPPKALKGCWDYFLRENIAILASSGMQGASFSVFSQD